MTVLSLSSAATRKWLAVLGMAACLLLPSLARGQMDVWLAEEGRSARLSGFEQSGVQYASARELAQLLHLRTYFNNENQKMVLYAGSHAIKLTADSPFLLINDEKLLQLPREVVQQDDEFYVPLILFLNLTREYLPGQLSLDEGHRELRVVRAHYNVTGIDVENRANGYLIRLSTAKRFEKRDVEVALNREWLNVTFVGGTVDTLALTSTRRRGIVKRCSAFQYDKAAQVSFQLSGNIATPEFFVNDGEVVISLREDKPVTETAVTHVSPDLGRQRWLIDTIVLDPGHGGPDPGSPRRKLKMHEKDITLDIAKKLKRLLENNLDVKVLMTRSTDVNPELGERPRYANSNNGKLFVSIHCNGNDSSTPHGVSVYVMGRSKTEEALRVAEKENSVAEDLDDMKEFEATAHILNAMASTAYLKESMDLGQMMVDKITRNTKIVKLGPGVYQGALRVLWRAAMPAVLVETAFMSNRYDEKLLNTAIVRQKIAQSLYEAIAEFKKKYEQGIS